MQVTGLILQLEGFGDRWTIPSSASRALVRPLFRNAQPADLDVLQERSSIASAEFSPSLPHCGHRMVITAVAPGAESNELEDVTRGVQYGATLTRTMRPLSGDAHTIARRA